MVYTYITLIKVKKNKEIHTFFNLITIILIFHALQNTHYKIALSLSLLFSSLCTQTRPHINNPPTQHQKLDLQLTR